MRTELVGFRVEPEFKQKIIIRAKSLGFDDLSDYIKQVLRKDLQAGGSAFTIHADQVVNYNGFNISGCHVGKVAEGKATYPTRRRGKK